MKYEDFKKYLTERFKPYQLHFSKNEIEYLVTFEDSPDLIGKASVYGEAIHFFYKGNNFSTSYI